MRQSFVDRVTQLWVRLTGRTVALEDYPWLEGPIGDTDVIGAEFFHRHTEREGLTLDTKSEVRGLLPDVCSLGGPEFEPSALSPEVARFYQETSNFSFQVTPHWRGGLRPLARLVSLLFSKRLGQLNIPLSAADAKGGATSDVFPISKEGRHLYSAWIRTFVSSGDTLYAGAYSVTHIPGHRRPCIKVVFPLPNGSAVVIMRPEVQADQSLLLVSAGERFGDPGFYF